jgi:hypothetical protein
MKQCLNRPGIPEWRRERAIAIGKALPKFNCAHDEADNHCHCCCAPFVPNDEGTACVEHTPPTCEPFSEWNNWSDKCLFFPPAQMKTDFQEHCNFQMADYEAEHGSVMDKLKLPEIPGGGPQKCGFCSFKIKCRTRPITSAAGKKECFPLRVQKKACGPDDCETCGNVCVVDKMMGSCNITDNIRKLIGPGLKSRLKKAPPGMRDGMMTMIAGMPHGKCIEKDDKCHCCCHPYDLNADGTSCVLKEICKSPEQLGVEVDMNLPAESFWF